MNDLKKNFLLAAVVALIQNMVHISSPITNMVGFLMQRMNYIGVYMNEAHMLNLCVQLFQVMVFEIVFGVYIYRHFCTACVYYFSRQDNRKKWFVKECVKLLGYSFSYFVFSALIYLAVGITVCHVPISVEHIEAIFYIIVLPALYTFVFTLWINVLSVVLGGANAFVFMAALQYLLTFLILLSERELTLYNLGTWKLYWNPVANMILDWHSDISGVQGILEAPFLAHNSLIYYIVITVISILAAMLLIGKQDISLENKEERG